MNCCNGLWVVSGKPSRHASAEIAAVRDEVVIFEAHGHQLVPESPDLAGRHPRGWRRAAERVAGE